MSPISTETAPHYTWGGDCDGWHLVQSAGLSVIQETMPADRVEVWHYHERAEQFFYVLDGVLTVEVAGEIHQLSVQQGIQVLAGQPHQVRNESGQAVGFLVVSVPPSHSDRIVFSPLAKNQVP